MLTSNCKRSDCFIYKSCKFINRKLLFPINDPKFTDLPSSIQEAKMITEGKYNINNSTLDFTTKTQYVPNTEESLNTFLNTKLDEGFECFASELFV